MSEWDSLTSDQKAEHNNRFLNELPTSDDFGSITLEKNGKNSSATIVGSALANHFPLWDAFTAGNLPENFNLGIPEFHKSSKPLDFIDHFSLSNTNTGGWFISKKAKHVFENFNLGRHKFYPLTITKNGEQFDYFLLAIKTLDDTSIDFPKSSFYLDNGDLDSQLIPIEIGSLEEYNKLSTQLNIFARNIILNSQFDKSKDLINFSMTPFGPYLSKRLITAIIEHKLTGIAIDRELNIHLSDESY